MALTNFMAFGDSITEGKTGPLGGVLLGPCPQPLGGNYDNSPISYPDVLIGMLASRYANQTVTMKPCGLGGETVTQGRSRFVPAVSTYSPQVLLLLEGANDLTGNGAAGIDAVVDGLAAMASYARGQGIEVFLATLLPQRPGALRAVKDASVITMANDRIRAMADQQKVTLVDLFRAFGGSADPALIDADGLHPTQAGHQLVAQTFFTAIKARLEIPVTTTAFPATTMRLAR